MAFGSFEQGDEIEANAEINMIPFIDIMLVLLIIFMITAPLMSHAVKVDLLFVRLRRFVAHGIGLVGQCPSCQRAAVLVISLLRRHMRARKSVGGAVANLVRSGRKQPQRFRPGSPASTFHENRNT